MRKKYLLLVHILVILTVVLNIYQYNLYNSQTITSNNNVSFNKNLLSMMVENDQGEYEESKSNEWPDEGYIFDSSRSKCENGGQINYQNSKVQLTTSGSDRCYVYFALDTMANKCELGYADANSAVCTILKTYGTDKSLYYHDGNSKDSNSGLEAGDNSYRYSGPSAEVNNYVCLDGTVNEGPCQSNNDLYRIIGLFKNENDEYELKLIKYDYATKEQLGITGAYSGSSYSKGRTYYQGNNYANVGGYFWTSNDNYNNDWNNSALNNTNLNGDFLSYLQSKGIDTTSLIVNHQYRIVGMNDTSIAISDFYKYEMGIINHVYSPLPNEVITRQIGLMYISDFGYAVAPSFWNTPLYMCDTVITNNWLYMGLEEWTISRNSATVVTNLAISINENGNAAGGSPYNTIYDHPFSVRPVFYLSSQAKILNGYGEKTNPYRIGLS